jgi:hypothetical protein
MKRPPKPDSEQRPLAFEKEFFYWNIQRVPHNLDLPDGTTIPHPGRTSGIFVVHGIGRQHWTETAARLRAGFEDAFERIAAWQADNPQPTNGDNLVDLPSPFIWEGYWANYDDIEATFPEDWKRFNKREQEFFSNLWKQRVISGIRTVYWMIWQTWRLLNLKKLRKAKGGFLAWLLYLPLQVVSPVLLLIAWIRFPKVVNGVINEVRLYLDPRGATERAIVQRIDECVEKSFLRMIGLDPEFCPLPQTGPLPDDGWIEAGGERFRFDRVVWVAHSLGTVISYNVLSALFHKAKNLETEGNDVQKAGVTRFRGALHRFVTMGSPLNKVAFLFNRDSLCPWPNTEQQSSSGDDATRRGLLDGGEAVENDGQKANDPAMTEWWVNFYDVFDPVSGALVSPIICGSQPPLNIHIRTAWSAWIPGFAHLAYWTDPTALRFILARTYGPKFLRDRKYRQQSFWSLYTLGIMGYFVWATILGGIVVALFRFGPHLLREASKMAWKWILG